MSKSVSTRRTATLLVGPSAAHYYRLVLPYRRWQVGWNGRVSLAQAADTACSEQQRTIVFQGWPDKPEFDAMVELKRVGCRVVLDVDTALEPPPYHPLWPSLSGRRPYSSLAANVADHVVAATQLLADTLTEQLGRAVEFVPSLMPVSANPILDGVRRRERLGIPSQAVVIAWLSPPAMIHDFNQCARAVERAACLREDAYFVFRDAPPTACYVPEEQTRVVKGVSFPHLVEWLEVADLLLLPLEKTLFNEVSSPYLLWEAGSRGVPVIASAVGASVLSSAPALVPNGDFSAWEDRLLEFIDNPISRQQAGEQLRATVLSNPRDEEDLLRRGFTRLLLGD